jgi:hypothetical protein
MTPMIQLSIMAMVLGLAVPMALPPARSRGALVFRRGFGVGVFGTGLAALGYALIVAP